MSLRDVLRQSPKNKHLLLALVAMALLNTLICFGLLIAENGNKRRASALAARVEALERDHSLADGLARLAADLRQTSGELAQLETGKAGRESVDRLRTELEARLERELADVRSELAKLARKTEQP